MASGFGERVRETITENFGLKVLSFAFALLLYSLVHGAQEAQRSFSVSLEVLPPPDSVNRVLVSPLPPQIRVTIRGPRTVVDDLRAEDIGNIQVDVHEGIEKRVNLDASMIHAPTGVRIEQVDPPALDLRWEDRITRDLPVQVSVVGAPAPGFVVHGLATSDPATVRMRGPRTEVQLLQHVRADAFDVNGLTEGKYTRTLSLDKPRGPINVDVTTVQVTAIVAREAVERLFSNIPVQVVGVTRARAQPGEVDVRLTCPPEVVRGLRPEQVVATAQIHAPAPSGSEAVPMSVTVDRCDVHITPASVVVHW